jgi:signal transduction histidine kinase
MAEAAHNGAVTSALTKESRMRTTPALSLPTLVSAPEWVAAAAADGLRLEVAHTGRRQHVPRSTRSAATAILRTALENAARHADASRPVRLEVAWQPEGLRLRMLNVPGETALGQMLRPGRGIASMASHAHHAGGWLRAGLCDRGFEVAAFLPCAVPVGAQSRAHVRGAARTAPALLAWAAGA